MKVHCRSGVVRYIKDTQGIGSLLLFAVLISPVSAHSAAPPQQELVSRAQEHVDRGDALFDKRRYEQAIDEYTSALALAPHPDLVWNIGRSYEELQRYGQAVYYFEQYRTLDVTEADRELASARIRKLGPMAKASVRGTLVVKGPLALCRCVLGGISIGQGIEVVSGVKPGRYRLTLECPGYQVFSKVVRIEASKRLVLQPKLELIIPPCKVSGIAKNGVAALVQLTTSGSAATATLEIPPGKHTVRLSSPRREGSFHPVTCKGGENIQLRGELGPVRHPERFTNWAGTFQGVARTKGIDNNLLDATLLTLDGNGDGIAIQKGERELESWRASHCGGESTLRFARRWQVSVNDGLLRFTDGIITECSCEAYCAVQESSEIGVIALPGFEGMITPEAFVVRTPLPGVGLSEHSSVPYEFQDKWEVYSWPLSGQGIEFVVQQPQIGRLIVVRKGLIPSYSRAKCNGAGAFTQRISYEGRLKTTGSRTEWSPRTRSELSCSCPGACGTIPLAKSQTLRFFPFTRYLFGEGILLARPSSKSELDAPQQPIQE